MKQLADGKQVAARTYYYLLDYMDKNFDNQPLYKAFGKIRLCDITIDEYVQFFERCTKKDLQDLQLLNQ
jgi:hypothetical protein